MSVESATALGPQEGFVVSYSAFPQGVIGGIPATNEYPDQGRALAGMCPSQTPEKSGTPSAVLGTARASGALFAVAAGLGAVCAARMDENASVAVRAMGKPVESFRIFKFPPP